jgi:MutS domain V/MutS domain III
MPVSDEYTRRLGVREAAVLRLEKRHARIGSARLALGAATVIVAWAALLERAISAAWLLIPIGAFAALVLHHSSVRRARARAERAANYYRHGIARIEDRWIGQGQQTERFEVTGHIYAADLDLFGKGSLFELLSLARTRMGQDTLAQWLLSPASRETIQERHAAVAELRDRLDLREELAVLGEDSAVGVHPEALLSWAETPNRMPQLLWVALLLPLLAIAAAVFWSVQGFAAPFLFMVLVEAGIAYSVRRSMEQAIHGTQSAFQDLKLFAALLIRVEQGQFSAPALVDLVRRLSSHTLPASQTMARLSRIVDFSAARANPFMRILDTPLMYSVHVALAAERWRREHGKVIRQWVSALGQFEALLSLAGYSYEHPDDPFPELHDGPASFSASELGHPLIPAAKCVRNSIRIEGTTRVLLVSGSNMSGKSTLLRTVGINTVLAMAGAPVRARRLRMTPLQIGASIRVNDSLHEGSSRFYAEITRLRAIYDLLGRPLPLLFLLDELLQGTNSKDRLIGAEGIVRAFVERGAIGLISTHDLALTQIGGLAPGTLRNVHFQDEITNGEMRFDFTLRDGIVTKSNGIELMRAIGLNV